MNFIKYRDYSGIRIQPEDNKSDSNDMILFRHCTSWLESVPTRVFNRHVLPLLYAHNMHSYHIIDRSRKKKRVY